MGQIRIAFATIPLCCESGSMFLKAQFMQLVQGFYLLFKDGNGNVFLRLCKYTPRARNKLFIARRSFIS